MLRKTVVVCALLSAWPLLPAARNFEASLGGGGNLYQGKGGNNAYPGWGFQGSILQNRFIKMSLLGEGSGLWGLNIQYNRMPGVNSHLRFWQTGLELIEHLGSKKEMHPVIGYKAGLAFTQFYGVNSAENRDVRKNGYGSYLGLYFGFDIPLPPWRSIRIYYDPGVFFYGDGILIHHKLALTVSYRFF